MGGQIKFFEFEFKCMVSCYRQCRISSPKSVLSRYKVAGLTVFFTGTVVSFFLVGFSSVSRRLNFNGINERKEIFVCFTYSAVSGHCIAKLINRSYQ